MHKYLRTKLATEWPEKSADASLATRLWRKFELKILSNPTYHTRMHLVKEWLIEFDGEKPGREIGLGEDGKPVLAGPTTVDYGFWLDTNMHYSDFKGTPLKQSEFIRYWVDSATLRVGTDV